MAKHSPGFLAVHCYQKNVKKTSNSQYQTHNIQQ